MVENYGNDSIHVFKEHEAIRKNPELYLGSKGLDGALHTAFEISGNAVDEFNSGYGDLIEISLSLDNVISIRDYGRGVPLGYNSKFEGHNWFYTYCYKHAGGKYGDHQEELAKIDDWSKFNAKDFSYLFSVGLYGIGASATQFTSDFLRVESIRDGIKTYMDFEDGQPVIPSDFKGTHVYQYPAPTEPTDEANGTLVRWRPSSNVFTETKISKEFVEDLCRTISYVSGCATKLHLETEEGWVTREFASKTISDLNEEFREKNGTALGSTINLDFLTHGTTSVPMAGKIQKLIYVLDSKISMFSTRERGQITVYHNGMRVKKGVHFDAVNSAIIQFFQKEVGLSSVKDYELLNSFNVIISTRSNHTDYNGADKFNIESAFIFNDIYNAIYDELVSQYKYKSDSIMNLVDLVKERVSDRLEYETRKKQIAEINRETKKAKPQDVEKFAPSTNYIKGNYKDSEIYYVEGDSAGGSAKAGRNILFQSVYPLTGKPSNATKLADISALKKAVVKNIIQLDGTGAYIPSMPEESKYDNSKKRFSKHIIFTDADKDGWHIRAMTYLIFLLYKPDTIKNGDLYICDVPLYKIMYFNGETDFAYNIPDRDRVIAEASAKGKQLKEIKRLKGIGEMNADDVAKTCMNPETRKLIQIKHDPFDEDLLAMVFEMFGLSTTARKKIFSFLLGSDIVEAEENARVESRAIDKDDDLDDEIEENFIIV